MKSYPLVCLMLIANSVAGEEYTCGGDGRVPHKLFVDWENKEVIYRYSATDLWSFGDEDSVCSVYATAILPYKGIAYGYCFNRSLKTMVITETEMNIGQGRPSSEYSVMKCF